MKQEMTLELVKAYYLDRVKELKNQIPFGDPFVFLGGFTLLNSLSALVTNEPYSWGRITPYLEKRYGLFGKIFESTFYSMTSDFSLGTDHFMDKGFYGKLNLTHDDGKHLDKKLLDDSTDKKQRVMLTVAATPFLNDIEDIINEIFTAAETDKLLQSTIYVAANGKNRLVGYGEE